MNQTFILQPHPHPSRELAIEAVKNAPDGIAVVIKDVTRTLDQNATQWPYLQAMSEQKQWPVNGQLCWITPDEWKDILTAAFQKETMPRLAAGLDGGVVMLGQRTSQFGKKKFGEWIEFLIATTDHYGVEPVFKTRKSNGL